MEGILYLSFMRAKLKIYTAGRAQLLQDQITGIVKEMVNGYIACCNKREAKIAWSV